MFESYPLLPHVYLVPHHRETANTANVIELHAVGLNVFICCLSCSGIDGQL